MIKCSLKCLQSAEVEVVDVTVGLASELEVGGGQIYPTDKLEIKTGVDSLWVRLPEMVWEPESQVAAAFFECILSGEQCLFGLGGLGRERGAWCGSEWTRRPRARA